MPKTGFFGNILAFLAHMGRPDDDANSYVGTKTFTLSIKNWDFPQKRPNLARNWDFWSFWARLCQLIWWNVGGLVGGCGAQAVSIYLIICNLQIAIYEEVVSMPSEEQLTNVCLCLPMCNNSNSIWFYRCHEYLIPNFHDSLSYSWYIKNYSWRP